MAGQRCSAGPVEESAAYPSHQSSFRCPDRGRIGRDLGSAAHGGDSESVQGRLKDGSVVTWGDTDFGGDSRAVQGQLKNVQSIGAGRRFFVAIGGRLHF